jgi:hypothetical protein
MQNSSCGTPREWFFIAPVKYTTGVIDSSRKYFSWPSLDSVRQPCSIRFSQTGSSYIALKTWIFSLPFWQWQRVFNGLSWSFIMKGYDTTRIMHELGLSTDWNQKYWEVVGGAASELINYTDHSDRVSKFVKILNAQCQIKIYRLSHG